MIPNTYKDVIPNREMMKLSDAMKRIDLDSFVGEGLELILLNLRMEPSPGEEEMRYKLVLTINVFKTIGVFEWYVYGMYHTHLSVIHTIDKIFSQLSLCK